ncbi:hypothetical protein, partial [Rhodoplanes sp. SY1]|uniref:hypothetical protein n=1 Tax=Rhodoplanes sp. SY1 TaxID=3166646 RepID=UPI0038B61AA6
MAQAFCKKRLKPVTAGREHAVASLDGIIRIADEMSEAILMRICVTALRGEAVGEPHLRPRFAQELGRHYLASRRR